jgi:hypothetical protein
MVYSLRFFPELHYFAHVFACGLSFFVAGTGIQQSLDGVPKLLEEIRLRYDVVPLENRSGSVPRHCHSFRNTGAHEVPDGGPAEIMLEAPGNSRLLAGGRPGVFEVPEGSAGTVLPQAKSNQGRPGLRIPAAGSGSQPVFGDQRRWEQSILLS